MGDGGKGSAPRPYSVPRKVFDENFDRIFRKDKRAEEEAKLEDEEFKRLEEKQKTNK